MHLLEARQRRCWSSMLQAARQHDCNRRTTLYSAGAASCCLTLRMPQHSAKLVHHTCREIRTAQRAVIHDHMAEISLRRSSTCRGDAAVEHDPAVAWRAVSVIMGVICAPVVASGDKDDHEGTVAASGCKRWSGI